MREIFLLGKDASSVSYHSPIAFERLINKMQAMTRDKGDVVAPWFVVERV